MAPYAIALGVDNQFARQFGNPKLTTCHYLEVSGSQNLTAKQWNDHLRKVLRIMDMRRRKMLLEKILGRKL